MTETQGTVTLLITDVVSSTELLQRLGEDATEVRRREHVGLLRESIAAHGGREVKNLGDGLMVVFSSTVDAVGAAVAIQQAVERRARQQDQAFHVRVGIDVGEPTRHEGDFFGTPVVVASRLCNTAAGDQIVVSELVRRLVGSRGGYQFRDLGPLTLKGIEEPVTACEVAWEPNDQPPTSGQAGIGSSAPLPLPGPLAITERTPFVGREADLGVLREHWELARQGQRRLVLLVGEPGVGKTRLAVELALAAHGQGATVLFGRTDEEAVHPYQTFVEALRHYVATCPLDQLHRSLGPYGPDLARLLPDLADRVPGLPQTPPGDAETERYRLFEAVASLLAKASQSAPLVVILDDLHWADKPTLLMLKHIVRSHEQSHLLLIGTYREAELDRSHPLTEMLADLRRDRAFDRVSVAGMDEAGVAALIRAHAGEQAQPAFTQAVHKQTQGNPFFIQELLDHVAEVSAQTKSEQLADPNLIGELDVPEGVREVIGRRLGHLSEDCNHALSVGAVAGREFELSVVERVSRLAAEQTLDVLDEAVRAHVVVEVPGTVGRYSFAHVLVRDMLYHDLTSARRVHLHRKVGEAIETVYSQNLAPHLAELAHHFFEASTDAGAAKAVDYARRAGERANALLAYEDAAASFRLALRALELQPSSSEGTRCEVLVALGDAQNWAGESRDAMDTFLRAGDVARDEGMAEQLALAALGFADSMRYAGQTEERPRAVALTREAIDAIDEGDSAVRARMMGSLAMLIYYDSTSEERDALTQTAVEMAQRIGDTQTIAYTLHSRHSAMWEPRYNEECLATATQIVRLGEDTGDKGMEARGEFMRIDSLLELGDIGAVNEAMDTWARLAEEVRLPSRLQAVFTSRRAMLALLAGRFAEAEQLAEEALQHRQRAQDEGATTVFAIQMFTIRREQGRLGELEDAMAGFIERYPEVRWKFALLYIHNELGRDDVADEFADVAAHDFTDIPLDINGLIGITLLAEVCASLADVKRAGFLYNLLLPYAERNIMAGVGAACNGPAARFLGQLAATMGRWQEANEHFERALEMSERMGARPYTAHIQREYAEMLLAKGEAADLDRAAALLREALPVADELGMTLLSERTRSALEQL